MKRKYLISAATLSLGLIALSTLVKSDFSDMYRTHFTNPNTLIEAASSNSESVELEKTLPSTLASPSPYPSPSTRRTITRPSSDDAFINQVTNTRAHPTQTKASSTPQTILFRKKALTLDEVRLDIPQLGKIIAKKALEEQFDNKTHHSYSFQDRRGSLTVISNQTGIESLTLFDADASRVFKSDKLASGKMALNEVIIDSYICHDFHSSDKNTSSALLNGISSTALESAEIADDYFAGGEIPTFAEITTLQSKSSASKIIYIDYLGGTVTDTRWNIDFTNGEPIEYLPFSNDSDKTSFSPTDLMTMYAGWAELAEDYAHFAVNITTDIAVYNATPKNQRSRIIATSSKGWYGFGGGVAYVDVYGINSDAFSTAWTFNNDLRSIGITHSHEAGHQMGLLHDGNLDTPYDKGHGNWGTIMGSPYGQSFIQWSKGDYPDSRQRVRNQEGDTIIVDNTQDDISVIAEKLGVSPDDAGNNNETADTLIAGKHIGNISLKGSSSNLDKDVYTFTLDETNTINIGVRSLFEGNFQNNIGLNLSAKVTLRNNNDELIAENTLSDNASANNFAFSSSLSSGTYFLTVEPQSYDSNTSTGFNEYGNGGYYQIISNIPTESPIPDLAAQSFTTNKTTVNEGDSLTLNGIVANLGNTNSSTTTLRYYRSDNASITASDTQVASATIGILNPNATQNNSKTITVTPTRPGKHYYGFCVDNIANETNTANNCSAAVEVNIITPPDLSIRYFSGTTDESFYGENLRFRTSPINIGGLNASSSTLRYYRSNDAIISSSDTLLDTDPVRALSPNESVFYTFNSTTPNTSGDYYYGSCIDTISSETNTSNNCSAGFKVTVVSPYDFAIINFSANKSTAFQGESLTLSNTSTNIGEGESFGSTLQYYRSIDANITTTDTPIGTDSLPGLKQYATQNDSISTEAPSDSGVYYYGACIDTDEFEAIKNNNCSSAFKVTVGSRPDLVIDNFSVNKSTAFQGENITLSNITKNIGESNSSSSTLRYYRSNDATISSSDIPLTTVSIGALSLNAQDSDSASVTAPNTSGEYYYGTCVDSVVNEINTSNNCSTAVKVTVISPPDLRISNLTTNTTTVTQNSSLSLTATALNAGEATASSSKVRFYRSNNSLISIEDTQLATKTLGSLGENVSNNLIATVSASSTIGTYYYGACVDADPSEAITTNNCSTGVRVTVIAETFPDLTVKTNNSSIRTSTGEEFSLSFNVDNIGTAASANTRLNYYRSTDNNINLNDTNIGSTVVNSLGVNSLAIKSPTLTTPGTPGTYYYGACALTVEDEKDATNNCSNAVALIVVQGYIADEYETDNTSETAKSIRNKETQTHNIHIINDIDWLTFEVIEDANNLKLSIKSDNAQQLKFELYDATLNSVVLANDASTEDLMLDSIAKGTYYIRINENSLQDTIENYEITLSYQEPEDTICLPIKTENGAIVMFCL